MKTQFVLICILTLWLANSLVFAQSSRTFKVCDVELKKEAFPEFEYIDLLQVQKSNNSEITAYPRATKTKMLNIGTLQNHFVVGLQLAYAYHRPFVISPDMVWLLICQGFANHVKQNAEQLRSKFIDFKGKKDIIVYEKQGVNIRKEETWVNMLPKFRQEMQKELGANLHNTVINEFSTSTDISKIAFEISLMDAMSPYFDYVSVELCGIPEITLEGTVEDWKKVKEKTNELKKYDLAWWIDELNPILEEFVHTAEGKENQEFWQHIYKYRMLSNRDCGESPELITGWITKFFPYLKLRQTNDNLLEKNSFLSSKNTNVIPVKLGFHIWEFPTSISSAKIKFIPLLKPAKNMEFIAGMIGISQNSQTFALKPEINWAVLENLPEKKEGEGIEYPELESEINLLPKTTDTIFVNHEVDTLVNVPVPIVIPKKYEEKNDTITDIDRNIFTVVRKNAEPKGGMIDFNSYLSNNLIYPESAKKEKIEGKVYLQFVVNEDGSLTDFRVVKGIGGGCDEEALRLLQNSPKWKPAKHKGKLVRQRMVIPIHFKLE